MLHIVVGVPCEEVVEVKSWKDAWHVWKIESRTYETSLIEKNKHISKDTVYLFWTENW